jgi:XTP/dITP diphosphohydrolase
MKKIFIGTCNRSKQEEFSALAKDYPVKLYFPSKDQELSIQEIGATYEENALLKAKEYQRSIADPSMLFVGDDSGLCIPALNNEPGLYSKRWAGYEMTDQEILEYCLTRMKHLQGDDRKAFFETVLAMIDAEGNSTFYRGKMWGRILEKPGIDLPHDGFPFRSTFWVDAVQKPWYLANMMSKEERKGFLTARETAFKNLLEDIS